MKPNSASGITRREFLRQAASASAGVVLVRYLSGGAVFAASPAAPFNPEPGPFKPGASQRYEGPTKVTGGKIYGIDFRAKDLPGWPKTERRAVVLRANVATKVFLGVNPEELKRNLGDIRILTGNDIAAWGVEGGLPFLMPTFYVRSNTVPAYLGQPVAMVSFSSTPDYLAVKTQLADPGVYCRYGEDREPESRPPYGVSRFVRYLDQEGREEFSFLKDGPWSPPWEAPDQSGSPNARASFYIQKIEADLKNPDWRQFQGVYSTQSVDPMFMEAEGGLAWYDSKTQTLSLTLGTQSAHDDGEAILDFFAQARTPKIRKVVINCCYPGGGFGGRDSSDFPLHLAIAAIAEPDVSHRLVHTRFEQFQAGLKRHPATVDLSLAIDPAGRFQALHSDIQLDGGGQNNYSFAVQSVAARNAAGGYRFPRSWVDAVASPSSAIPSGSMRGYGTFQSTFGLECLIDEAAQRLAIDPIDLRLRNVMTEAEPLHTGVTLAVRIYAEDVLKAAQECRLWRERQKTKAARTTDKTLFGVGFALGVKTFGKNEDACLASLTLDSNGRLGLMTNGVDMGNGSATTLPLSLADILGRPADEVQIGVTTAFDPLQIVGPTANNEAEQAKLSANPHWVPFISMSTAASSSAYQMRHAVREAGKALLELGLWPAAVELLDLKGLQAVFDPQRIKLNDQGLIHEDGRSVSFTEVARKAHERGLITGVMVHAFYRTRWARAAFPIDAVAYRAEIDALAVRHGAGSFQAIARQSVDFPPWRTTLADANRMTSYTVVLAVEIQKDTGEVRVVDAETFLDCGPPTLRPIVEGQMEGAFAMGIGQTLIESFPLKEGGPGQGTWNLHLYRVPLARDCALGRAQFNILPPHPGDEPRGMSEVVFNPVPAAIINAVADATGKRFRHLPLKSSDLKAALS